ncbi:MAG: FKBP-type peptidyl-prolyl cis-trans isomerase [Chitinophagaceae bacterium]|jgi:FKBP-type peptidyl-prolyl cis-trans isomerase FkpA|nr:FKBP-type peptidyl-prolyl cis-trans isomerase [Chitinophagaceae bacterium]
MRIKVFAFLTFLCMFFIGCKKGDSPETLEQYITRANLTSTVTKDSRGFYYQILNPGTGATPTLASKVTVFYKGTLTDGSIFDQTAANPVTFGLSQLIVGWQYGIPLVKAGGRIMLYLPPSLGYGAQTVGSIPANSVLIFDITLQSVQ